MRSWNEAAEAMLQELRPILRALVEGREPDGRVPELPGPLGGIFVTIYDEAGELRGSGGTTRPDRPPDRLLVEACRQAALDDPRFPPLRPGELAGCRLAITLLAEGRRIRDAAEVEPGVTALRVQRGIRAGTTTPEVAWGRGWDAGTFLAYACRKAGLPARAFAEPDVIVEAHPSARAVESA